MAAAGLLFLLCIAITTRAQNFSIDCETKTLITASKP
jgi:hypothetical protein